MNDYYREVEPYFREPYSFERVPVVETYPLVRGLRDEGRLLLRDRLTKKYSWSIPTEELVEAFAEHSPIVSVGAGTAYIESLLVEAGATVVATDVAPFPENDYDHGAPWMPIEKLDGVEAIKRYDDRTLLLSWPPFSKPMGYEAIAAYRGDVVLYLGEGRGGCNGDDDFWPLLDYAFDEEHWISIPRWSGINDFGVILRRRK